MEYDEYLLPIKQVYAYYDEKYVWPCNESVKLNRRKSIFVGLHQFIQIHLKYICVML